MLNQIFMLSNYEFINVLFASVQYKRTKNPELANVATLQKEAWGVLIVRQLDVHTQHT